jgi:Rab3 GTPase-activating protein regulatory subunit N-terminus
MFKYAKSFWSPTGVVTPVETNKAVPAHPSNILTSSVIIPDPSRSANQILVAPASASGPSDLAVVSDALGRVFLMDTEEMQLIRMWKGMRDAQCGWVQIAATNGGRECTTVVLLLLIYSSRGLLEVYSMRHGDRILISKVGQ